MTKFKTIKVAKNNALFFVVAKLSLFWMISLLVWSCHKGIFQTIQEYHHLQCVQKCKIKLFRGYYELQNQLIGVHIKYKPPPMYIVYNEWMEWRSARNLTISNIQIDIENLERFHFQKNLIYKIKLSDSYVMEENMNIQFCLSLTDQTHNQYSTTSRIQTKGKLS